MSSALIAVAALFSPWHAAYLLHEDVSCQGWWPLVCRRTLLVIAHRINTIMDSDMLLVLSDGKLVEQGSPSDLSQKPGGTFARLVQAAQQSH